MTSFNGKYITSYLMSIVMFALSLSPLTTNFPINKKPKVWPWKWRSSSRRKIGLVPFNWKCLSDDFFQNCNCLRNICVNVAHTSIHTDTQKWSCVMDKGKICKVLQICLKIISDHIIMILYSTCSTQKLETENKYTDNLLHVSSDWQS